jgi:hypothetical protein
VASRFAADEDAASDARPQGSGKGRFFGRVPRERTVEVSG